MGILCAKCPSFAMNDDPDEILCDRCWRDAKIEVLKKRLLKADAMVGAIDLALEDWGSRLSQNMEELLLKAKADYGRKEEK